MTLARSSVVKMHLPDLIEIVPLEKPVRAEITVPGSKSITNRALILAALAEGEVTLEGALWSEDTQVMVDCLQKLGFEIKVAPDPNEFCNRTITVKGLGGKILPRGGTGTTEKPLELFVGNAGTAARFLSALVCLGDGVYRLHGIPRMHERPQAALFKALRELGYRVEAENGNEKLPARIFGHESFSYRKRIVEPFVPKYQEMLTSEKPRSCKVSVEESSQFASALMLCEKVGGWKIEVVGENAEESPYVAMTAKLIQVFPSHGGKFQVEPDTSSGSYFLAAGMLAQDCGPRYLEYSEALGMEVETHQLSRVEVAHWPNSGWQADERFRDYLVLGAGAREIHELEKKGERATKDLLHQLERLCAKATISRQADLGDSIMTAIVWCADKDARFFLRGAALHFVDLGRLRLQECERVVALRTELTKCGAKVIEEGDTLTVYPSKLHGAEIETYNDHRMAMCFAILGLKVPGIKIKNPSCVKKTFPNFFQKLAAEPPHGLGATIWEIKNGKRIRKLEMDELFAD